MGRILFIEELFRRFLQQIAPIRPLGHGPFDLGRQNLLAFTNLPAPSHGLEDGHQISGHIAPTDIEPVLLLNQQYFRVQHPSVVLHAVLVLRERQLDGPL